MIEQSKLMIVCRFGAEQNPSCTLDNYNRNIFPNNKNPILINGNNELQRCFSSTNAISMSTSGINVLITDNTMKDEIDQIAVSDLCLI